MESRGEHHSPARWALPTKLLWCALPAVLVPCIGCEADPDPQHYRVHTGKVVAYTAETGELSVRVNPPGESSQPDEILRCVVTRDSEIYLNGRSTSLDEIQIGDPVEIVGYPDPNPSLGKFVVTFASIEQTRPAPPIPDLLLAGAASTQPTTQDSSKREDQP